jgi:tetratricopeptide (TPR) repeat protein
MIHDTLKITITLLATLVMIGCAHPDLVATRSGAYQAYQAGRYAEAAEQFETLVAEIPKDAELWFRLGNAYARAMEPRKAVEAYENALLRNPQMAKAWYNKGLIHMQTALKTFVEMDAYVAADDPVGRQGRHIRERLWDIIENPGQEGSHEE